MNKSITLKEAEEAKRICEIEIQSAINKFNSITALNISRIDLTIYKRNEKDVFSLTTAQIVTYVL